MTSPNTKAQASADTKIASLFTSLLAKFDTPYWLSNGNSNNPTSQTDQITLFTSAIILLDQFPRHIHRTSSSISIPSVSTTDSLALSLSTQFLDSSLLKSQTLPSHYFVFALMPFRHAASMHIELDSSSLPQSATTLRSVLTLIDERESLEAEFDLLRSRFRKASGRRLQGVEDKLRGLATAAYSSNFDSSNCDADILEAFPFDADYSNACKNALVKSMETFLVTAPTPTPSSSPSHVFVSLSGGVDSMVIADILVFLRDSTYKDLIIVGIHIDYGNRSESTIESDYVEKWCKTKNIEFRVRKVDEVKRGKTARDEYEKISRFIRYDTYKTVMREFNFQIDEVGGIFFGHHIGDVQENVISNSMKGAGPLSLSGMAKTSVVNGVRVFRPLLTHNKRQIFDYAHTYGVPYFKDTTPSWSTRGKCRNLLLPLLTDIFGEGFLSNLSNLAFESDAARDLLNSSVVKPFTDLSTHFPATQSLAISASNFKHKDKFFWETCTKDLLHSVGLGMLRGESINMLLRKISGRKTKGKPGELVSSVNSEWIEMRPDYHVFLRGQDLKVFVLNWRFFAKSAKQRAWAGGERLEIVEEVARRRFGNWIVEARFVVDEEHGGNIEIEKETALLNTKLFTAVEDVLGGEMHYYTLAHSLHNLQLASKLTKRNKPKAVKGLIEDKLLSFLPIFIDETVIEACGCEMSKTSTHQSPDVRLVCVTMEAQKKE